MEYYKNKLFGLIVKGLISFVKLFTFKIKNLWLKISSFLVSTPKIFIILQSVDLKQYIMLYQNYC